jgi:toxic protein SymE
MKYKKLRIYSKFRRKKWDHVYVPEIRLEGKWLNDLGFKSGKKVQIKMENGKLTITIAI